MACTCFRGQAGVQGAEGAPGEGVMFSIINRASAALQASHTGQRKATAQKGREKSCFSVWPRITAKPTGGKKNRLWKLNYVNSRNSELTEETLF